jgi:heat shock protein HtpX
MNHVKTILLMIVLTAILLLIGGLIAGENGVIIAFIIALAINFFSYWFSDKMAISMTRSKPLNENQAPQVYKAVRELVNDANMPMPKLYLMPVEQPNAFAAGRNPNNAVITVTSGLMDMLEYDELKGVLAHELAHIRNRDILISTLAAVMAGALMFVARIGMYGMVFGGRRRRNNKGIFSLLFSLVAIILAPLAATIIRMAISRTREYGADATGAQLAHNSEGLASALEKMDRYARQRPLQINEATSHMFIINPLSARGMSNLFSTHPPLEERIKRLRSQHGY